MSGRDNNKPVVAVDFKGKHISTSEFVFVIDQLTREIAPFGKEVEDAIKIVANHMNDGLYTAEEIADYYEGTQRVPIEIYRTAKSVWTSHKAARKTFERKTNGRQYVQNDKDKARENFNRYLRKEKEKKKEKSNRNLRKEKEKKRYELPEGHAPLFALDAIVDRLMNDHEYEKITAIDHAMAIRGYCKRGHMTKMYNKDDDCPADMYGGLVKLLADRDYTETDTEGILDPVFYDASGTYMLGQLMVFNDGAGVVTEILPKNKMTAVMSDGEVRTYRMRSYHDKGREKNTRNGISMIAAGFAPAHISESEPTDEDPATEHEK